MKSKLLEPNQMIQQGILKSKIFLLKKSTIHNSNESFSRKFFSSELENDKNVKLIYYGQILSNDDKTLSNYRISDETVVHCLILKNRPNSSISGGANNETVRNSNNLQERIFSHLLLDHQILLIYLGMIIVTLTLLFCWYCR